MDCGECNNGTRGGVSLCHPSNPSELCVSWLIPLTLIHSDTLLCLDEPAVNTGDGGGVRRGGRGESGLAVGVCIIFRLHLYLQCVF